MYPVRLRERLMDPAYPAWFMWCASSLLDGISCAAGRDHFSPLLPLPGLSPRDRVA